MLEFLPPNSRLIFLKEGAAEEATAAEQANATAITAEETRATAAEAALQNNIDSLGGLSIAEVYIHNTSAGAGTGTYKISQLAIRDFLGATESTLWLLQTEK